MVRGRRQGSPGPQYASMGDRLRQVRTSRGMSLRSMAKRLGVSPSLVSQVETGRARPSVSTLYALANELSISLDELLFVDPAVAGAVAASPGQTGDGDPVDPPVLQDPVQRAASRVAIRLGSGVVWERLTTRSLRDIDFLHVSYEVGAASSPEDAYQRHHGREWGYVLSGSLRVNIAFDEFVLGPDDAITFDSSVPHRLSNVGGEPVRAVWFVQGRRTDGGTTPPEVTPPEVRRG